MKNLLMATALLFIVSCSQKVLVTGIISAGGAESVVFINDTLRKFSEYAEQQQIYPSKQWEKLRRTNKYAIGTDKGRFTVMVKKTDSLAFYGPYHRRQMHAVNDLLKQKYIYVKLEEVPCNRKKCEEKPDLYIIVASKISLKFHRQELCKYQIPFDSRYDAVYNVKENIYGGFTKDTIHFASYDHYGRPRFEDHENVLLFIGNACGRNYQIKYQYAPLYKTTDGRWATPYMDHLYSRLKTDTIKPEVIPFENPVEYPIDKDADTAWVKKLYPAPYYKIEGNKATAVYGNYIPEIIALEKEVVLKSFNITITDSVTVTTPAP